MKNAINNRVKEISVFRKGSCATMGYLSFALLVSMAMAAIPKLPNKPVCISKIQSCTSNEIKTCATKPNKLFIMIHGFILLIEPQVEYVYIISSGCVLCSIVW